MKGTAIKQIIIKLTCEIFDVKEKENLVKIIFMKSTQQEKEYRYVDLTPPISIENEDEANYGFCNRNSITNVSP